ncbi:MAG: hypothetical protein ACUVT9_05385 [Candidatus Bathycorpusculaceae bacterium]
MSSEYWEMPIFIPAYFGLYGTFPQWQNHVAILIMAVILVKMSKFQLSKINFLILLLPLIVNIIFFYFLVYPEWFSWILRTITILCLGIIFVKEIWRNIS